VRSVGKADDDVGAGAGIRGHRRLLVDVLPADEVDLDIDARLVGEALGVGAEHLLVRLHEAHRSKHAQGRAFLDRKVGRRDVGGLDLRSLGLRCSTGCSESRGGQPKRHRITTGDVVPHQFLPVACTFPALIAGEGTFST